MDIQPSFLDIEKYSHVVEDNEFFTQYTNHELPNQYDSNFVLLRYAPTLPEFQLIETMHQEYQQSVKQEHLHFYWPENTGIYMAIMHYLNKKDYEIGMQELMHTQPQTFQSNGLNRQIEIDVVDETLLPQFLKLNYSEDIIQGIDYAEHKEKVYHYQFKQSHVQFLIASIDQQVVGSLILIASDQYLELDNVLTDANYRKQGVATAIIASVMKQAIQGQQSVILVADAEDSPKKMYEKMGFKTISTQINAQKTFP